MKRLFLHLCFLLTLLLCSLHGFGQRVIHISGIVRGEDFSPLKEAGIYIEGFSNGVFTDSTGHFTIATQKGPIDIGFSNLGFLPQQLHLVAQRDTFIEIIMKMDMMDEVVIMEKKEMQTLGHNTNGVIVMNRASFNSLPAFLGENDPMRAVQMQPGVQSGNEGARGIFIRGGSPDQNLILIDGATVYNPSHIYGFTSVFNGDAIDHLNLYKDKYPSRFGGRLCSVMDLNMDEGNPDTLNGSLTLGLVLSKVNLNGPIDKKHTTTFSISGRMCYVGVYTSPISKHQYKAAGYSGDISYYFGDVNAKLAHRFKDSTVIELNYFSNNDKYVFKRNDGGQYYSYSYTSNSHQSLKWANYVATAAIKKRFNSRWNLINRFTYSRYNIETKSNNAYVENDDLTGQEYYHQYFKSTNKSYIQNIGWKGDVILTIPHQTFSSGAGVSSINFETGKGNYSLDNTYQAPIGGSIQNGRVNAIESYLYLEDEYQPNSKWTVVCGFHARIYNSQKRTYASLLPRVNLVYKPVRNFSLRAAAAGLSQNMHLLVTSSADVLNDYWVPATRRAMPETGWNFSFGMIHKLPKGYEWSIDGYYRIMNNLIEYKEGALFSSNKPWEDQIATGGKGKAYGAEFYFAKTTGIITASVAYTLGWSTRKFLTLNNGEAFPFKYDRRHNIAAQINCHIGKHFDVGAAWVYGSGNMFTLPLQKYTTYTGAVYTDYAVANNIDNNYTDQITTYTKRNAYRLPSFQHLDVSFTYHKRVKKIEHSFNLSVYNVYNRFNIFSVYTDYRPADDGGRQLVFKKLSLFPVLPSISYTIKFAAT